MTKLVTGFCFLIMYLTLRKMATDKISLREAEAFFPPVIICILAFSRVASDLYPRHRNAVTVRSFFLNNSRHCFNVCIRFPGGPAVFYSKASAAVTLQGDITHFIV